MEFVSDNWRWTLDQDGQWLCFRANGANKMCESLDDGKTYKVTVTQHRNKRSLDANAYAWVLIDKLAERLQNSKTEIYRQYIREIGGVSETVCVLEKAVDKLVNGWAKNGVGWQSEIVPSKIAGCVNVILYFGSSTYDAAQMSRFIDMIVHDCKQFGIETLTPMELDALKERWV